MGTGGKRIAAELVHTEALCSVLFVGLKTVGGDVVDLAFYGSAAQNRQYIMRMRHLKRHK